MTALVCWLTTAAARCTPGTTCRRTCSRCQAAGCADRLDRHPTRGARRRHHHRDRTLRARRACRRDGLPRTDVGRARHRPAPPNISAMVGELYDQLPDSHHAKRDSGFSLFYLAINVGAWGGVLVTGWLAHRYGWHVGFAAAAIGIDHRRSPIRGIRAHARGCRARGAPAAGRLVAAALLCAGRNTWP